jgi:S-adenosylmethionine synthetase
MVAAGVADEILIQVTYAIGIARPVGVFVNTRGTARVPLSDAEIAARVATLFDLRPRAIEERLKLRNPIYLETASYGHMGRVPRVVKKRFDSNYWPTVELEVELFTWEKLDYIDRIREAFL